MKVELIKNGSVLIPNELVNFLGENFAKNFENFSTYKASENHSPDCFTRILTSRGSAISISELEEIFSDGGFENYSHVEIFSSRTLSEKDFNFICKMLAEFLSAENFNS